jgi:hypothetical protein
MDKGIKSGNCQGFSPLKTHGKNVHLALNFNAPLASFSVPVTVHCYNLNNKKSGKKSQLLHIINIQQPNPVYK